MKSFTCTNIVKGTNNQVIFYEIQDSTGKTIQVSSKKLKILLENNKIAVVNLIIKNNELIEDPDYQLKSMIAKFKIVGKAYKSACRHEYYVLENSDTTIVYIPDDVKYLVKSADDYGKPGFCNVNCKTLKVIGGSGLISTYNMFYKCKAQSLDFSSFNTSKVTNMDDMFNGCRAQSIDLSSFDTSNVTNMKEMFYGCETQSLDLSSFDISKVKNMGHMFEDCKAQSIDLSSFDASNKTYMSYMFYNCKAQVKATDRKILVELNYR